MLENLSNRLPQWTRFVEKHLLWILLAMFLALIGAFSAGRFSAPLKVETREVEKIVFKDRVVEKVVTVEVKGKTETKIVFRDVVKKPDGTITTHEEERTGTKEDTTKTENNDKVATHDRETTHETIKIVTLRPNWRIGVLVGGQYPAPIAPLAGPLVLGAIGEYRIVGGLSAGVWITTGLAAGLSVSFEF